MADDESSDSHLPPGLVEYFESLVEGCTWDDVVGDHNPKMIAIWGGNYTKEEWFLRHAVSTFRLQPLLYGLEHFHALCGRYPTGLDELEDEGFHPIRFLDPITGESCNFGVEPANEQDFLNIGVSASTKSWHLRCQFPIFPDGKWVGGDYVIRPGADYLVLNGPSGEYSGAPAMRGAMLAQILNSALRDYQYRRNEMPHTATELLDGLWTVDQKWAGNDSSLAASSPCVFVFGTDTTYRLAAAIWSDESANLYRLFFGYSPWPEGGWTSVPSCLEMDGRQIRNGYGVEWPQYEDFLPADYLPETILWKSSLLIEDEGET